LLKRTSYVAPHYAVFSSLPPLPSYVQIISSAPCSQTPPIYVLSLMLVNKLHTHNKQQVKLWLRIFYCFKIL